MVGGRKTRRFYGKEKSQPHHTINCSVSARNLRKSDLGAVIFGCKHNTITECNMKQLFGLPFPHFSYVKNVTPGLTLFLFNYSDRKLHGIFEAASPGQLNINPNAWTVNGEERTPYPAQVRIRVREQCRALREEEFKPIIAANYYDSSLFWFELDRKQTQKLIDLFSSSTSSEVASPLNNAVRWNKSLNDKPSCDSKEASSRDKVAVSEDASENQHKVDIEQSRWTSPHKEINLGHETPYSSVVCQSNLPQRSWSSFFKNSAAAGAIKGKLKTPLNTCTLASSPVLDQSDMDRGSTSISFFPEGHSQHFGLSRDTGDKEENIGPTNHGKHCEDPQVTWDAEGDEEPVKQDEYFEGSTPIRDTEKYGEPVGWSSSCMASSVSTITDWLPLNTSLKSLQIIDPKHEGGDFDPVASDFQQSDELRTQCETLRLTNGSDGGSQEVSMDNNEKDVDNALGIHHGGVEQSLNAAGQCLNEVESSVALAVGGLMSSDIQSLVAKLMQEIGELKRHQLMQNQKINYLEQEVVKSKLEIQQMRRHCNMSSSAQTSSLSRQIEGTEFESLIGFLEFDGSILIVGGYDGSSWSSALSSYSPSSDLVKYLTSMTFLRTYSSAAKLDGELYLFGGVHGDVWYDTVESYNLSSNQWSIRPSLHQRKGSLAGVSVSGKLFAIGGGNGIECFADVEMFDTNIGKWIYTEPMQEKRFAPAAAEINGTLYVVGGYDGRDYLKSVERFDSREHKWTALPSMNTRRGCNSLVALNGKLYALGGFDGEGMVSTVEIFDSRASSWITGESMKAARGYSGAAVIGEKIYVIGGLSDNVRILDTIEFYKEGCGWQLTNLKGVGKKCFFNALVM